MFSKNTLFSILKNRKKKKRVFCVFCSKKYKIVLKNSSQIGSWTFFFLNSNKAILVKMVLIIVFFSVAFLIKFFYIKSFMFEYKFKNNFIILLKYIIKYKKNDL